MRIISVRTLREYWEDNPRAEEHLKAWVEDVRRAEWDTPEDIKKKWPKASIVGNNRVVFNIRHNEYRLVVAIYYRRGKVFVRFVGTHDEYDKIDVTAI